MIHKSVHTQNPPASLVGNPLENALPPIKTMKLYSHFERVDRELLRAGKLPGSDLQPEDLYNYDHMNYYGTTAVETACERLSLSLPAPANTRPPKKVLDIGSGLGGPARYMHKTTGAQITALEMQHDCCTKAAEYTKRCGISSNQITHVCGDILKLDSEDCNKDGDCFQLCNKNSSPTSAQLSTSKIIPGTYDCITSWLVFLHIPDKALLFKKCYSMLKDPSGDSDDIEGNGRGEKDDSINYGQMYIEDFYEKGKFSETELESLKTDVYAQKLPTRAEYIATLQAAGFADVIFEDLTDSYREFVFKRAETYYDNRENVIALHGEPTFESQMAFFNAMKLLFGGGNLGGVRITCSKKKM